MDVAIPGGRLPAARGRDGMDEIAVLASGERLVEPDFAPGGER